MLKRTGLPTIVENINNDEKTNNLNTIAFDGDSVVWFGVESGVHKYFTKKKLKINLPGIIIKTAAEILTQKESQYRFPNLHLLLKKFGLVLMSL